MPIHGKDISAHHPAMGSSMRYIVALDAEYLSKVVPAGELMPSTEASESVQDISEPASDAPSTAAAAASADATQSVYCRVSDLWLENAAALRELSLIHISEPTRPY